MVNYLTSQSKKENAVCRYHKLGHQNSRSDLLFINVYGNVVHDEICAHQWQLAKNKSLGEFWYASL